MKRYHLIPLALLTALLGNPALAQEYWEYEPLEGETERHQPTAGLETEYENDGDINVEREGYEWEAGEGYHEEEWYDPSDWFDDDSSVDYENGYDYDYYDEYDYDYGYDYNDGYYDPFYGWGWGGYGYDYYDYDYDYALDDDYRDVDYEFGQQLTGRVEGLQRIRGSYGAPQSVRLKLKTEYGQTRNLHLGDLAYVSRALPRVQKGDDIIVGGEMVERDGKQYFQAREIRTQDESFLIPEYEYQRQVEGELEGLRKVQVQDGNVEMLVARVRTDDGKTMNVRLGRPDEVNGIARTMRRGSKVRVDGYRREVNGKSSFVVQDFKVLQSPERSAQRQGRQQNGNSRQR